MLPGSGTPAKLVVSACRKVSKCCCSTVLRLRSCITSTSNFSTAVRILSTCFCRAAFLSSNSMLDLRSCRSSASRAVDIKPLSRKQLWLVGNEVGCSEVFHRWLKTVQFQVTDKKNNIPRSAKTCQNNTWVLKWHPFYLSLKIKRHAKHRSTSEQCNWWERKTARMISNAFSLTYLSSSTKRSTDKITVTRIQFYWSSAKVSQFEVCSAKKKPPGPLAKTSSTLTTCNCQNQIQ